MAEEKPKPTYAQLEAENAALRRHAAALEAAAAVKASDEAFAAARAKRKPAPRDPDSPSAFRRPYDGR